MTINEIIELVDAQRPNAYDDKVKIHWLDQLDRMVWREICINYEEIDTTQGFDGYSEDQDGGTDLLIPDDYKMVYVYWLQAMIDFANQEMSRYTNSMIMFNTAYSDFANFCNRTYTYKGKRITGADWRVIR